MTTAGVCSWSQIQDDLCLSLFDGSFNGVVLEGIIFLLAFAGLAIAAEHLCNSMETLCDHWHIHEDVGGATFIALGGAIPEITINCISTFKSAFGANPKQDVSDLGVGAILGSGMIAYLVIPSLVCLVSVNKKLTIRKSALLRDSTFYGVAALILISALFWGINGKLHGSLLVVWYGIYVLVLVLGDRMHFWWSKTLGNPHLGPEVLPSGSPNSVFRDRYSSLGKDAPTVPLLSLSYEIDLDLFDTMGDEELDIRSGSSTGASSVSNSLFQQTVSYGSMICGAITRPLRIVIDSTCPDCRIFQKGEPLYLVTFLLSFAWITFFSFVVTVVVGRWVGLLNIPAASAAFGVVLVAVGAEIPDSVNALTIAKRGFGGMATSACLGSQVINICLGLGMPWLVTGLAGKDIPLGKSQANNTFMHLASLFVVTDVLLLVMVSLARREDIHPVGKVQINQAKALALIAWYCLSVGILAYSTVAI